MQRPIRDTFFFIDGGNPCTNVSAPTELSFTTGALSILLSFITLPGNFLVVLAIFIDPNRELSRSPFNYFVANLAMADLLVGVVTEPVSAVYHIKEGLGMMSAGLPAIHMPFFISTTASILSLAALTLDRFVAISNPMKYRTKLNPARAAIVCAAIWIVSLSFPFVYFHVGYIGFCFLFGNTTIVLTFIVLLFAYIRVYRIFKIQVKQWDTFHKSTFENRMKKQTIRWEQKITKTFLIMLVMFIGCYLPACVFIYIINLCPVTVCSCYFNHWVRDLMLVFVLANSCLNPFLYSWRLYNFRCAFLWIITCGRHGNKPKKKSFEMRTFRRYSTKTPSQL